MQDTVLPKLRAKTQSILLYIYNKEDDYNKKRQACAKTQS
jgi:hypothetical protein